MTSQRPVLLRIFFLLAGFILLIAASGKIGSANGHAPILRNLDPVFAVPFREVLFFVATLEIAVAMFCFFSRRPGLKAGLIAWLATGMVVYRLGLIWIGYSKPCSCMGNITDALHIPPQVADNIVKIILAYLLIGSYATLFWLWRQNKWSVSGSSEVEVEVNN